VGTGHAAGGNALFLDTVLAPPFGGKRWKGKMNTALIFWFFCLPTGQAGIKAKEQKIQRKC
jgi:hypothetical protein